MKIKKIKSNGVFVYPATISQAVKDPNFHDPSDNHVMTQEEINTQLNDRLETLENAPDNSLDVKIDTIKLYRKLGTTNTELKSLTDDLRYAMVGRDEFAKLGTGLFIHWGVYAVPAGNYTGEKVSTASSTIATKTSINYNTEWIMRDLGIPKDIYKAYENQFTAENWDPEALCKAAHDCGMGYVVITIKHHDGFSLYPTEYGSWDVRSSAARNTIIDELKAACDKYKLKFGLYFSQYWDWMAEGGFGLNHGGKWCSSDPYTAAQHTAYCNQAAKQIEEFVKKYEPFILWYDPGTNYAQSYKDIFINAEENNYPHVLTNDRLDYNRSRGDFGTGERTIYLKGTLPVGEACFTMNDTWGYSENNENKYFGIEKVMKQFMIFSLSYGQNCLMNIGPKADGSIPAKQLECLQQIKTFCDTYGHYKNYKRITTKSQPKWGYMLELEGNKVLCYVVTKGNPATQDVTIDCVDVNNIDSIDILTPGTNASYEIVGNSIVVHNLALDTTTKIGVVRINYNGAVNAIDANYYKADVMIPSRVFPLSNSSQLWDFDNLYYKLNPSRKADHTSEFIWNDYSGNYTLTLNRAKIVSVSSISEDDVTTVTITDLTDNSIQTLTYGYLVNENATSISLVNGRRYSISVKCTGTESATLYTWNGFTFTAEVIIIPVDSVNLNHEEIMIEVGGSGQIEATVSPNNATDQSVTWSSSDEAIATVEDGMITGIAAGSCIVTATSTDGNKTATCSVIITAPSETVTHATGISFESSISLLEGETHTMTPVITPEDTTYKNIEWESSDTTVATVSHGVVTAIKEGTAVITGKLEYDQLSATCNVTVNPIAVTGVELNNTTLTLIPGFEGTLTATVSPANASHKDITWTISNSEIATVTDGVVFAKKAGTATVSVITTDGNYTATCALTVNPETYDYLWEVESLSGSADQGDDTGITLFDADHTNWTLFGFVQDSKNAGQTDNNATLLQCVVNASPWTGYRIDADNNNYPVATTENAVLLPRFLAGTDNYINTITGTRTSSKTKLDVDTPKHPCSLSRNGDVYKYSLDGVTWTTFEGLTSTQLERLATCPLTIGFDYKRASGAMTTTKYRKLITDNPCCVAIKNTSEYPFYTLTHKYYTAE